MPAEPDRSTGPRCRCGHGRDAHRHYRRGTDCALCPGTCPRWRPTGLRGLLARLLPGG